MIEVSVSVNPYSVKNECGDFYLLVELEDYHLLCVGDIGGHGSSTVYEIANKIKKLISNHKEKNIKDILKIVHESSFIKHTGMTIFLAQVYKKLPLINYCAIGNTRSLLYRDNNLLTLNIQEGIVGYDIPSHIEVNMLKLLKNDLLVVATDGVSFHNTKLITSKLKNTKDLDNVTEFFTHELKNEDDSLCMVLKFKEVNTSNFSIDYSRSSENTNDPISYKEQKAYSAVSPTLSKKRNTQKIDMSNTLFGQNKNSKLWQLDKKYLLAGSLEKDTINLAIDKLKHYGDIQAIDVVKIKTFLHELSNYSNIDLYIKENILQIVVKNIGKFKQTIEFLFDYYYVSNDETAIINFYMDKYLKLDDEEFKDLYKMIKLNLNDKDFIAYKEREKFLSDMAYKDNLTKIYNRNKFNEIVDIEFKRDKRYHRIFSVGIIDIDHFKSFNDTYGHLIGDEVLIMLARCLESNVRSTDTYARWGGEEFVLLFPETDANGAYVAAENLRKSIEQLCHETAGGVTASFGITQYQDGDTIQSMFKRCDDALYDAKDAGRNRVCIR